jgi:hypothetical protein
MFSERTGDTTILRWVALDGRLLSVWRVPEPPDPTIPPVTHRRAVRRPAEPSTLPVAEVYSPSVFDYAA